MADVISLCAALTRLGFSAKGAGFITNNQGLDTLDELKVLINDEIESLCKVVRRPGGTISNPNTGDTMQLPNSLLARVDLRLRPSFARSEPRLCAVD